MVTTLTNPHRETHLDTIDLHETDLDAARKEIRALRAELATASVRMDRMSKDLMAARGQVERNQHQLRALRLSRSWKITRPIRMFKRRTRGGDSG